MVISSSSFTMHNVIYPSEEYGTGRRGSTETLLDFCDEGQRDIPFCGCVTNSSGVFCRSTSAVAPEECSISSDGVTYPSVGMSDDESPMYWKCRVLLLETWMNVYGSVT